MLSAIKDHFSTTRLNASVWLCSMLMEAILKAKLILDLNIIMDKGSNKFSYGKSHFNFSKASKPCIVTKLFIGILKAQMSFSLMVLQNWEI